MHKYKEEKNGEWNITYLIDINMIYKLFLKHELNSTPYLAINIFKVQASVVSSLEGWAEVWELASILEERCLLVYILEEDGENGEDEKSPSD